MYFVLFKLEKVKSKRNKSSNFQEWTEKKADAADEDNANVWEDNW